MTQSRLAQMELDQTADFTRQRDFFDPTESKARVTIVGCGGIGSATAVLLSKMGIPEITLIDPDILETHNLPNQFYPVSVEGLLGEPKVDVLASVCKMFGYSEITTHQCRIEDYSEKLSGIVVTGLDSMEARKNTWELVKKSAAGIQLLVDGRIGGQEIVVWSVNPKLQRDVEEYEKNGLFSDNDGEEAPCTARAVIDVMSTIAGAMVSSVRIVAASSSTKRTPVTTQSVSLTSSTTFNALNELAIAQTASDSGKHTKQQNPLQPQLLRSISLPGWIVSNWYVSQEEESQVSEKMETSGQTAMAESMNGTIMTGNIPTSQ